MRGDPQAIAARIPRITPSRRWRSWIAESIQRRREARIERLVVIERIAREQRHARQRGQYVPDVQYRVRPW